MSFSRVSFVETSCAVRCNNLLNPVEFMVTYVSYPIPYFQRKPSSYCTAVNGHWVMSL